MRHLLAKDILRFHCVYWPALLLAAGYDVPRQLFVHGYLLLDDRKISKSLGNVVDPLELIDVYGADAVRFWCARSVSFGQDGDASVDGLRERYERELGNDLGNLLSRVTAMIARYRGGALAAVPADDSPVAALLTPLGNDVAEALDTFDLTGALERIWEVVRALNRHVEATAPWQLAKDERALGRARPRPLRPRRRAARRRGRVRRLPARHVRAHPRGAGQPTDVDWDEVAIRANASRRGARAGPAALPARGRARDRGVTDSHAHLDACAEPDAVVARANDAGVTRIVTIGTGIDRAGARSRSPSATKASSPRSASTRIARRRRGERASTSFARCSRIRRSSRWGRPGSTATTAPTTLGEQRALLDEHLALAESLGLPVVIHSRAASAATAAALEPFRGTVILHCFSEPELLEPALERGYYVSFAGNVTYPSADRAAGKRRAGPRRQDPRRDRHAVPCAAARPRPAQRAGERLHTLAALAEARGDERAALEARSTRTRPPRSGSPTRDRVAPKKALGQHFLVDRNVLGVIERLAGLRPEDVVLEIGPGLGVLTTFLADRVAHVHAVELDRSLDAPRAMPWPGARTSSCVFGDALALDLAALDPTPRKLVSNLPYNIATPLVVESLTRMPDGRAAGA